jgi:hypothetical protein
MGPSEVLQAHLLYVCYNSLTFPIPNKHTWYDPISSISLHYERNICKMGSCARAPYFDWRSYLALERYKNTSDRNSDGKLNWQNIVLKILWILSSISYASFAHNWCRWCKQTGLSLRRTGFSTRSLCVASVVDKLALRKVPSTYFRFLLSQSFHQCSILIHSYIFFPMARQPLGGLGRLIFRGFTITHIRHTTLGRTPLDEGPVRRRDLYLTTHNTQKRQTSMP